MKMSVSFIKIQQKLLPLRLLDVPYLRIWIINFYLKFSGPFSNSPKRFAYLYIFFDIIIKRLKTCLQPKYFNIFNFEVLKTQFCQMDSILFNKKNSWNFIKHYFPGQIREGSATYVPGNIHGTYSMISNNLEISVLKCLITICALTCILSQVLYEVDRVQILNPMSCLESIQQQKS